MIMTILYNQQNGISLQRLPHCVSWEGCHVHATLGCVILPVPYSCHDCQSCNVHYARRAPAPAMICGVQVIGINARLPYKPSKLLDIYC